MFPSWLEEFAGLSSQPHRPTLPATWVPALDLYRSSTGWLIKVELAGVRAEDVKIECHRSQLRIEGMRRDVRPQACGELHQMEIAYSHFVRQVELPDSVETVSISTESVDGMLWIHLRTRRG